ncbi:MAG: ABC transporter substrate-binding protein [Burkholderiales bacterium]
MRRAIVIALACGLIVAGSARAAEISISCSAVGLELELCRDGAQRWARESGNSVRLVSSPNSATERLALYQQLLAAGSPDIDVLQIDAVWPGILARHLLDLAPYAGTLPTRHFPALVANDTVRGKLVAMPWFADVGLLYYRKDLLRKYDVAVPRSWRELADAGRRIEDAERTRGNARMWGYVWQGRAYEGLTCDALEWIASRGGGHIVEPDGVISVDSAIAAQALTAAAGWIGVISPRGVLNYAEEEARGVFQSGNAVFMRNWPYARALAESSGSPVRGKVGIAMLPGGIGVLGGAQLAVSRYSRHPALAASLVMWLTGRVEQKRRALAGGFNPTLPALYDDPEIRRSNPYNGIMTQALAHAVTRPAAVTGTRYNRVSSAFANAVHAVLAGQADAATALRSLDGQLMRISRGGRW